MNQNNEWMKDPTLQNIDKSKLDFLQQMLFESKQHTGKEMLPFFMSLAMRAKSQNISFTEEEINAIIAVLERYASPEELLKMRQAVKMFRRKR